MRGLVCVSWGKQQGSKAYILIFTSSSQFKYPQGTNFLCLQRSFSIIMLLKIPFCLFFKCCKVFQKMMQEENSCFLLGRDICREIVSSSSILYKKGFRICHLLKVILGVCRAPSRMILDFWYLFFWCYSNLNVSNGSHTMQICSSSCKGM